MTFVFQECVKTLDAGAKEALTDIVNKVLRKVAAQPENKEDEFDDTIVN